MHSIVIIIIILEHLEYFPQGKGGRMHTLEVTKPLSRLGKSLDVMSITVRPTSFCFSNRMIFGNKNYLGTWLGSKPCEVSIKAAFKAAP